MWLAPLSHGQHTEAVIHAGPEIGVASTKAFTAQVTVLTLMALHMARVRGTLSESRYRQLLLRDGGHSVKIEQVLQLNDKLREIAYTFKDSRNALYLWPRRFFPGGSRRGA